MSRRLEEQEIHFDVLENVQTFPQLIRSAGSAYGEETAIVLEDPDGVEQVIGFQELDSRSSEVARSLLARGIGKGSRIGFIFGNGPSFAVMLAGIARIGAVAVPISTMCRANELVRILRRSDVAGLFVQRHFLGNDYVERICEALPEIPACTSPDLRLKEVPFLRWIVSDGASLPPAIETMSDLLSLAATVDEDLLREVEAEVHPTDQMIEIYTSGSMSLPKGVRHNHGSVLLRAQWLREKLAPERRARKVVPLPMFWVGGMMMALLPNWLAGAVTVCTERTIRNSRVAMGSVLADEDLALIAGSKPYWSLGMTETLGPYSWGDEVRLPGYPLCAPIDNVADHFELRIVNERNEAVTDGEAGEIQIRGYPLSAGLHKIERSEHYTVDGFYRTGDMGLREGRRVHFVGRGGEMIKAAGSNVSPAEVEMELQSLEGIDSAYVVGLPDSERGQLVAAAVVPSEGYFPDFSAIEVELRKRLSSFKVPRAYVTISREDIPMLPSNKIAKRDLAILLAERLSLG